MSVDSRTDVKNVSLIKFSLQLWNGSK